jgi:hypothetical protein
VRDVVTEQSAHFAVVFSSRDIHAFTEGRYSSGRELRTILLPLIPCSVVAEQIFLPMIRHASNTGRLKSILSQFPGSEPAIAAASATVPAGAPEAAIMLLSTACARLSGGHPRSAAVIFNFLEGLGNGVGEPVDWEQLVERVRARIGQYTKKVLTLTATDVLSALSTHYIGALGEDRVAEWVRTGVMNVVAEDTYVLPLVELLPFSHNTLEMPRTEDEWTLASLLCSMYMSMGRGDAGDAYKTWYALLLQLLPLVRNFEVTTGNTPLECNWKSCTILQGLCGVVESDVAARSQRTYVLETLTASVSGKLFDFTQRRGLKVYQPGDLSSMSEEDLQRYVWQPSDHQNMGFDLLLFVSEVDRTGAAVAGQKLLVVVIDCQFSGTAL